MVTPEGIYIHAGSNEQLFGCITTDSIWQHEKGGLYRITQVTFSHDLHDVPNQLALITYHKCDERGIYESIRDGGGKVLVNQPFTTTMYKWIKKYKFIKQL